MFQNWAYTNNGGKPIHHRIYSSHYILKVSALVSGAQRGLFQMVYLTFNIHRLYLVNLHIFITSYLAHGPLKYSKITWKNYVIFYEPWNMTSELLDLICIINIQKICMNSKHEQTELGARNVHVFYLNKSVLTKNMAVVCILIVNPVYANKNALNNHFIYFIYSRWKPLYVNWSMYIMPLSGCLAVYYNYDY